MKVTYLPKYHKMIVIMTTDEVNEMYDNEAKAKELKSLKCKQADKLKIENRWLRWTNYCILACLWIGVLIKELIIK